MGGVLVETESVLLRCASVKRAEYEDQRESKISCHVQPAEVGHTETGFL